MCFSTLDIHFFVRSGHKGIRLFQSVRFLRNSNMKNTPLHGKSVYCWGLFHWLVYMYCWLLVGKSNELMNLLITYTYLLICPLSPKLIKFSFIFIMDCACGRIDTYIGIFNSFVMARGIYALVVTDTILLVFQNFWWVGYRFSVMCCLLA